MNRSTRTLFSTRGFLAVLLAMHLLAVAALEASPRLHQWVHPDEDHDDDCAVIAFLHGGCDLAPLPLVAKVFVGAWEFLLLAPPPSVWVESIFASSHLLEHAPPCGAVPPSSFIP